MELDDREHTVRQREREHHHAKMTTVVEERQKSAVQSRQRANAENDVEQRKRSGCERSDQQCFDRQLRTKRGLYPEEHDKKPEDQTTGHHVVAAFLRIPRDGSVGGTHRDVFDPSALTMAGGKRSTRAEGAGRATASTVAMTRRRNSVEIIQRWRRRSGRIIAPALRRVRQRPAIRAPSLDAGCLQSVRAHQRSTARQTAARAPLSLAGSTTAASLAHQRPGDRAG